MTQTSDDIWVLADDRAGNVAQALGVGEALAARTGRRVVRKDIAYSRLAALPNRLRGASRLGLAEADLAPPWPALVIGAGRRTAPLARWIKRQSIGATRLAQIMWPGHAGAGSFEMIAVPEHDRLANPPPNVMRLLGAPHRVTPDHLEAARAAWAQPLGDLPAPRIALIVGGGTKGKPFTPALARDLAGAVKALCQELGGSLMVTTSRRTGAAADDLLAALPPPDHLFRWDRTDADNPYFGYLAWADVLVVTGDSVSMVCEACASGHPVRLFAPPAMTRAKHRRLHQTLYATGMAAPLGAPVRLDAEPPRLDPTGQVVEALLMRLGWA
ncbi:mitochondrial fission ELM1 family protein [Roseospirillum parvum]|uniref:Nucleoside-diphosphate sugar epimerase n=1 Tax=Roseospirillum parvum TaxID=83401 RepID=A0A1G8CI38_9PROT|nr:mitochondrial fission ELM1 family protein [Roseospirillum parvum]SDH45082.1 hypothetical protein SAMN05421742_1079 [Roseospirillum parvum]